MEYPGIKEAEQNLLDVEEVKNFIKYEWLMLAQTKIDVFSQSGSSGIKKFYTRIGKNEFLVTFTKDTMGPLGRPITIYNGVSVDEAVRFYNGERVK